jgi:hypothetical protein
MREAMSGGRRVGILLEPTYVELVDAVGDRPSPEHLSTDDLRPIHVN